MQRLVFPAVLCFVAVVASSARAQESTSVEVYAPDTIDVPNYSYAHDQDGNLRPDTEAGNVVRTSRGRIMSVVLTTHNVQGAAIDGLGVLDITNGKNIYGRTFALDDTEMKTAGREGEWKFKCQLQRTPDRGLVVAVWADPDYLDRTSRDAFSIKVDDLYFWRSSKAIGGADTVFLGKEMYHVVSTLSPGSSMGWAFFKLEDMFAPDAPLGEQRVRPRYFVQIVRNVEGNFVTTRGPEPIGDTGYVVMRNPESGELEIREGPDAPLKKPGSLPTIPAAKLPKIPTLPALPRMPTLPALPKTPAGAP